MITGDISHVAIRAKDLTITVGFYRDALGLVELPRPSALAFPGAWIGVPGSRSAALHIYAKEATADPSGVIAPDNESGAVDHVAFRAREFSMHRDRLVRLGLSFREQHLNDSPVWQLFVHDPNGVKVEISFDEREEAELMPALEPHLVYSPKERFFDSDEYMQFKQQSAVEALDRYEHCRQAQFASGCYKTKR